MFGLFQRKNRFYLGVIAICTLLLMALPFIQGNPEWVEKYYARGFYPVYSYLSIILFSWLPFSVGDLFYALVVVTIGYLLYQIFGSIVKRSRQQALLRTLQLIALLLFLYCYFYIN
jgi:hypothetical protein